MSEGEAETPGLSAGEQLCAVVAGSAALFYWAEKDDNPGVKDYWDALHYVSTALSVGYANLFPVTPLGKVLAAALMTMGPAMASRALEGNGFSPASDGAVTQKLDEVVAQLRQLNERLANAALPPA